jgi:ribonuclease VapC
MVVDASAIISILTEEDDGLVLSARLGAADDPVTQPVSLYEAATAIMRLRRYADDEAWTMIERFLSDSGVVPTDITPDLARRAVAAFSVYGKASGHPARLNMGDCFTYALAASLDRPILYKGDDFARTDRG